MACEQLAFLPPHVLKRSSGSFVNDLANQSLLSFARGRRFETILADPPWRFQNRTGKMAPEHVRLARYRTMGLDEIGALPVGDTWLRKTPLADV